MKYRLCLLNWLVCLVVAGLLATSCTSDDWGDSPTEEAVEGFQVSLTMDGMKSVTRSGGVDALNENIVKRMDVFLFGPDEDFMTYAMAGDVNGTSAVENVILYQGNDWKDNFDDNSQYTLYVLANYKGTANLEEINTVQGLKDLVATDADIAKWEGMPESTGNYTGKTFLMDGTKTFQGSEVKNEEKSVLIPVDVRRAAVKVEVTLKFSEDWKAKFTATELKAQFAHYATATAALAEAPMLDADQRGFATYPEAAGDNVLNRFSTAPVFETGTQYDGSKIRFYAYVNNWQQEISNETMFLIDLPGIINDTEHPENNKDLAHNFYKIPIVPNGQEQNLTRNTFYQVTAVVDMEGSSTVDEPVELKDVSFEVAYWTPTEINVGDGDDPEYLMLNEYHVEIRNVDGYDGIHFYSSSPIVNVEVVGFDNQAAADEAGVDFQYPGDKTLEGSGWYATKTDRIPGAFYVNKDNMRKPVSGVTVSYEHDVTDGWIHLVSDNPENVTKRYITLKVTNKDGQSKYVVVEQYPLEYIQPIAGYYSYRDDKKEAGGTYEDRGTKSGQSSNTVASKSQTYFFVPKVMYNGQILGWYWNNRGNKTRADWPEYSPRSSSFDDNNMMYFVTITKTDSNYKIAHPLTKRDASLDNQLVAVETAENDNLVSPQFMLASQLGTVLTPDDWAFAQKHCAYYVETYKNKAGQTVFLDDWRLPTTAEINVIIKYQNDNNVRKDEVMSEVLGGQYYYVAKQGAVADTKNGEGTYVRCIRDVKPTDEFLQK
ncbi:hypothetical protein I6E18_03540 [Phocaeicola barnesiae]|uniref:fimbrial tip adhesin FimD n=1 Tax=Phocaeicola barnesiae TaxID=376804 RepID=UPI001F292B80|nr:hypothetical protein [Phocaeicola barnesiae]MCF2575263.1 hypothetical protein [Phocaeicola barnesiae]